MGLDGNWAVAFGRFGGCDGFAFLAACLQNPSHSSSWVQERVPAVVDSPPLSPPACPSCSLHSRILRCRAAETEWVEPAATVLKKLEPALAPAHRQKDERCIHASCLILLPAQPRARSTLCSYRLILVPHQPLHGVCQAAPIPTPPPLVTSHPVGTVSEIESKLPTTPWVRGRCGGWHLRAALPSHSDTPTPVQPNPTSPGRLQQRERRAHR